MIGAVCIYEILYANQTFWQDNKVYRIALFGEESQLVCMGECVMMKEGKKNKEHVM